jgi:hypothetical protein
MGHLNFADSKIILTSFYNKTRPFIHFRHELVLLVYILYFNLALC